MPQYQDRIQIELLGETFTIKGDASQEEVRRTRDYLNKQMELLKSRYPGLMAKNLALLTAFNLADELLRVKKDYEDLVSILDKA